MDWFQMLKALWFFASGIPGQDLLALLACWPGLLAYTWLARRHGLRSDSLALASARSRLGWAKSLASRPVGNRVMDASVLAYYNNSAVFFSSSALLALGAFLSLVASPERAKEAMEAAAGLGARSMDIRLFWLKAATAAGFFAYAFMKFTWAMRQIAFAGAVGAGMDDKGQAQAHEIQAFADLSSQAGDSFNAGLRAFYWSMVAGCWLAWAPLAPLAACFLGGVLWRREFVSATYGALARGYPKPGLDQIELPAPDASVLEALPAKLDASQEKR